MEVPKPKAKKKKAAKKKRTKPRSTQREELDNYLNELQLMGCDYYLTAELNIHHRDDTVTLFLKENSRYPEHNQWRIKYHPPDATEWYEKRKRTEWRRLSTAMKYVKERLFGHD